MTETEQQLSDRGFSADDINFIIDLLDDKTGAAARAHASRLLCLIFLRVEKDSAVGCALRRALGFSNGVSLARAARDFVVSKQYLEDLQARLEEQLGELSFLSRQARDAHPPGQNLPGPPGRSSAHR
jgi:hypothetical protein